jgi:hypothetical protein
MQFAKKEDQIVFLTFELKTATLDYGIPGISAFEMWLIFALLLAIPMIPYFFLYKSLGEKKGTASATQKSHGEGLSKKLGTWIEAHRRPEPLHHH